LWTGIIGKISKEVKRFPKEFSKIGHDFSKPLLPYL